MKGYLTLSSSNLFNLKKAKHLSRVTTFQKECQWFSFFNALLRYLEKLEKPVFLDKQIYLQIFRFIFS